MGHMWGNVSVVRSRDRFAELLCVDMGGSVLVRHESVPKKEKEKEKKTQRTNLNEHLIVMLLNGVNAMLLSDKLLRPRMLVVPFVEVGVHEWDSEADRVVGRRRDPRASHTDDRQRVDQRLVKLFWRQDLSVSKMSNARDEAVGVFQSPLIFIHSDQVSFSRRKKKDGEKEKNERTAPMNSMSSSFEALSKISAE